MASWWRSHAVMKYIASFSATSLTCNRVSCYQLAPWLSQSCSASLICVWFAEYMLSFVNGVVQMSCIIQAMCYCFTAGVESANVENSLTFCIRINWILFRSVSSPWQPQEIHRISYNQWMVGMVWQPPYRIFLYFATSSHLFSRCWAVSLDISSFCWVFLWEYCIQ
jgi:hypothetical protein